MSPCGYVNLPPAKYTGMLFQSHFYRLESPQSSDTPLLLTPFDTNTQSRSKRVDQYKSSL